MYFPALVGELLWAACVLGSMGTSLSVITEVPFSLAIIASAAVAVSYTFFGGQYSVCYTDVVQLIIIIMGLTLATPFVWYSPYWRSNGMDVYLNGTTQQAMLLMTNM